MKHASKNRTSKRVLAFVLMLVLTFSIVGTSVFAKTDATDTTNTYTEETDEEAIVGCEATIDEEAQTFTLPGDNTEYTYWVNPLNEDNFQLSDVTDQIQEYSNQISTLSVTVNNEDEAIKEFRKRLVNRESPIVVTYTYYDTAYSAEDLYLQATKHTGVKNEGDYIFQNVHSLVGNANHVWHTTSSSSYGTATVTYFINYDTTAEQENTVDKEATALLNQLGVFNMDKTSDYGRYQIVKTIYDWVCDNVSYDNIDHQTHINQTAYDALINRTSVCTGYANLLYRLLLEAGIDNRIILGVSSSASHVWNLVDMFPYYDNSWSTGTYNLEDGLWYYLDATWDAGCDQYTNFLCGSTSFNQSHQNFSFSSDINNYEINNYDYDSWYYSYLYEPEHGYTFGWNNNYQDCRAEYGDTLPAYRCTVSQTGTGQYTGRTIILNYNSGYNGCLSDPVRKQIEQLQELGYFPRHTILLGGYMPTDNTVRSMVAGGWRWYDDLSLKTYTLDEFFATGVDMIFYSSDYIGKSDYEFTWDQLAYFESNGITCIDINSLITDKAAWSYLYSYYDMNVIDSNKAGFFYYEGFWVALLYHQYVNDIPQTVLDALGIDWIISNTVCDHSYGEPTWHWAEDGATCRASFTCKYCGYETTVDATVVQTGTSSQVTCTKNGSITCMATANSPGNDNKVCSSGSTSITLKASGHPEGFLYLYTTKYTTVRDTDDNYYYEPTYFEFACSACGEHFQVTPTSDNWYYYATNTKQPTCYTEGRMDIHLCVDLHESVNSVEQYYSGNISVKLPIKAHLHSKTDFTWASDYSSCTVSFSCDRCGDVYETHPCTISVSTIEPTCSVDGRTVYTAKYSDDNGTYTDSQYVVTPKTEHSYSVSTMSARFDASEGIAYISMCCEDCGDEDTVESPVTYNITFENDNSYMTLSANIAIGDEIITLTSENYDADTETVHEWEYAYGSDTTCELDGTETYICTNCNDTMTITYQATGHDWDDGTVAVKPTCTDEGVMEYACTRDNCDATRTEPIQATGHTPEIDKAVDATCTKTGLTEGAHCSVCGIILTEQNETPMAEHEMGEWYTIQNATCIAEGAERRNCNNCDYYETNTLDTVNHTEVIDEAVPAICTETGLTEGSHCAVCNEVITAQEETEPLGHEMSVWYVVSEPTCDENGLEQRDCTRCGYIETNILEATGHKYSGEDYDFIWYEDKDGEYQCNIVFYCTQDSCSHIAEYPCEVTSTYCAPTCTEDGSIVYIAEYDHEMEDTTFSAGSVYIDTFETIGHEFSVEDYCFIWDDIENEDGEVEVACQICFPCQNEDCEYEAILDCDVINETIDPTCTEDGSITYIAEYIYNDTDASTDTDKTIDFTNKESPLNIEIEEDIDSMDDIETLDTENNTEDEETSDPEYIWTDTKTITLDAIGHNWLDPEFDWSGFDLDTGEGIVTAIFVCANGCEESETLECDVTVTSNETNVEYIATVEFNGAEYSDTVVYDSEEIYISDDTDDVDDTEPDTDINDIEETEEETVENTNTETVADANNAQSTTTVTASNGSAETSDPDYGGKESGSESPKTGDSASIVAYIMIGVTAATTGITVSLCKRKDT